MSLFDYKEFLEELKNNSDETKRAIYEKWIKISNAQKLEDEPFYEYLMQFEAVPYNVPEELEEDFDWDLLLRLCVASFSSNYNLIMPDEDSCDGKKCELAITVSNEEQKVTKKISELWSFQINNIINAYLVEQIHLYLDYRENQTVALFQEEYKEVLYFDSERIKKIKQYKIERIKILNNLRKKELLGG